jgi:hypothetical protein
MELTVAQLTWGERQVRRLAESNKAALRRLYAPALEGAPAARAALVPLHDTRWAQVCDQCPKPMPTYVGLKARWRFCT